MFAGKVVVVTGASSGIGRASALGFAREGASVVLVSRDQAALAAVAAEAEGPTAIVAADVTADDTPARVVGEAVARFGGLNVLVNAAGIIGTAPTDQTPDELFDRMMAINVRAPFRMMREAFPHLRERRGAVVNVSSVNGLRAFAGVAVYCSSKAALDHLTRCAALDWAPHGVRVNCVNPGVTVTNLHRRGGMDETRYAAFLERAKETHPLGRPGQADEIADAVLFMASDKATWITGDTMAVDGGRHLTCLR
ncbi:MAG: glucose 1-dehydrogenase [Acidobacteria bacterium]|nr:glucose 1-dehydrogenase [Acidobacteriota bacterium]